ncbi:hypothetical protein CAEBREN_20886 [Caenorhabditis brenneri]|uniref:BED-type domain-containing protein n=1 Tax=Caenorhabditis brenneri TaxID=135651 RepID=G0P7Y9_CAEBE|nr:hypothetical protein CAEBREN_20886 [Caenorhabditis brenneri]
MTEKPEFSIVWNFFEKSQDSSSSKCKKCDKELKYTGSTSGMISHLRSSHKQEMLEVEQKRFFFTMDGWESKYEGVGVYALIVYSISDDFVKEKFYESLSALTRFQEYLFSDAEKKMLEEFVRLLTPYMEAIASSEMNENFCSEIIPTYNHLNNFICSENQHLSVVQVLKKQTSARYKQLMESDVALLSTFLDPRFAYMDDLLIGKKWTEVVELAEEYFESFRYVGPSTSAAASPPPPKVSKSTKSSFYSYMESKRNCTNAESVKVAIPSLLLSNMVFSVQCGAIVSASRRNRLTSTTLNDLLLNAALANIQKQQNGKLDDEEVWDNQGDSTNQDYDLFMWKTTKPLKRSSSSPPSFGYDN